MLPDQSPVAREIDLVPGGDRPPARTLAGTWAPTAAAAVLHAAVLFAGSRAEARPPEEMESEAVEQLRRYLAASETRDARRDVGSPESQERVLNRLAEGSNGAGAAAEEPRGDGAQKQASAGHLASAATGAGDGKSGKGTGATAPFKVRYGKLPPEVIQRILRQSFGRFRLCFEQGSRSWSIPFARVKVRFVIGRTGAVTSAVVMESTAWEREINSCVLRSVRGLQFPEPEGGVVDVIYPFAFSPGD